MKLKIRPTSVVPLRGGFGNQLFCWAYGRALEDRGHRVYFDRSHSLGRGFALNGLIAGHQLISVSRQVRNALLSSRVQFLPGMTVVRERQDRPPVALLVNSAFSVHWGYWQSLDYFSAVADTLQTELGQWLDLDAKPATEDRYCAIHVRRGDYVSDIGAASALGTLSLDYYARSIARMREQGVEDFRVFTDDREWALNNILPLSNGITMSRKAEALEDFRGIALASSVITANSSFSWWATFIGGAESRPVISPKTWFADPSLDDSAITPDWWERI